jgi:hypothetical protein
MYFKDIESNKEAAERNNRELKAAASERMKKVAAKIKQNKQQK